MVKKIPTCVFISGNGTNLLSLIKSSRDYNFPISINLIISNNNKAKGLNYPKKFNIPYKYFSSKNIKTFERNCLIELKKRKIKFLCLAGFLKILSKNFITSFKYKIVNIHPSLLPKYKGLNTFKKVLESEDIYAGSTVHFVSEKLDSGDIILQKKFLISKNETKTTLEKKILKQEYKLYSEAIRLIFK